jgi:NhaP-type Na+/H+ or K+/H+ antiporter
MAPPWSSTVWRSVSPIGEEYLSAPEVSWLFLVGYGGGALTGAVTAWVGVLIRRRLDDALLGNVVTILTPFTAVLLAGTIQASGVLAVVVSGLMLSQIGPRVVRADTRRQAQAFLSLSTFLLNGALFVLVGLELHTAVSGLPGFDLTRGLILVVGVSAVVIGLRFVFLFASAYLIRLLDRRPRCSVFAASATGPGWSAEWPASGGRSRSPRPWPYRRLLLPGAPSPPAT